MKIAWIRPRQALTPTCERIREKKVKIFQVCRSKVFPFLVYYLHTKQNKNIDNKIVDVCVYVFRNEFLKKTERERERRMNTTGREMQMLIFVS